MTDWNSSWKKVAKEDIPPESSEDWRNLPPGSDAIVSAIQSYVATLKYRRLSTYLLWKYL